jgi:hypothetical protein
MTDIIISVLAGIINVLLMWYSVHISLKEKQKLFAIVVLILGLIGVLLIGLASYRGDKSKDELNDKITGLQKKLENLQNVPKIIQDIETSLNQNSQPKEPTPIPKIETPDVKLVFVHGTDSVAVHIVNPSKYLVRGAKYSMAFWNLDDRENIQNPLPIPVWVLPQEDYIRPGEGIGPEALMSLPQVSSRLKHGDRIFGFALVQCPNCVRTRTYWLYCRHEIGGWYAEGVPISLENLWKMIPAISEHSDGIINSLHLTSPRISIEP